MLCVTITYSIIHFQYSEIHQFHNLLFLFFKYSCCHSASKCCSSQWWSAKSSGKQFDDGLLKSYQDVLNVISHLFACLHFYFFREMRKLWFITPNFAWRKAGKAGRGRATAEEESIYSDVTAFFNNLYTGFDYWYSYNFDEPHWVGNTLFQQHWRWHFTSEINHMM